jgi:hypothetical protein
MKYYKYLDIDCSEVSPKLVKYIYDNSELILHSQQSSAWKAVDTKDVLIKVPELMEMVKPLDITIKYLAFFITEMQYGTIHIDHDTQSNCRINIPVLNCDNTETRFFTISEEPVKVLQKNGIPLLKINPLACTQVDKLELTRPVVFRNNQPHQVVSFNKSQPRISCTIGFYEDIEFLFD